MHGAGVPPPPAPEEPAPAPEPAVWTRQQDKLLELLLCRMYPRWDRIATHLGSNKTPDQACRRYERMVAELRRVLEAAEVATPPEWDLQEATTPALIAVDDGVTPAGGAAAVPEDAGALAPAGSTRGRTLEETGNKRKRRGNRKAVLQQKRSKAVPWSVEEHQLFLSGIRKYGKGRWQRLSWEFVRTRSPTQIASHYQKYALRQAKIDRNECKRPSIHDINDEASVPVDSTAHQIAAAAAHHDAELPPAAADEAEVGTTGECAGEGEVARTDEFAAGVR